jgi:redox-sensitive bicupin YhaK (pirin superfamily)
VSRLSVAGPRIFEQELKLKIVKRNILRRGGFAGLRETRLVMNPSIFSGYRESGTSSGLGRFCYLADASFLPHGETRMHDHTDIDVISVMVKGRIKHEGSMANGQELNVDDIQVQRAGSEGFSHNEINPDDAKNRMI